MNAFLRRELAALKRECSNPNWDGYDAPPLSPVSYDMAIRLARELPRTMAVPTPAVDNSGKMFFQWGSLRGRYLALTFGTKDTDKIVGKVGVNGCFRTEELPADAGCAAKFAERYA